jgi:hypothetical protein
MRRRADLTEYDRLWRVVEGAVRDALRSHPDYVPVKRKRAAVNSITKRVVGSVSASLLRAAPRIAGAGPGSPG